jgi:outer membrane protein OmpA-like peptidoglycan-associated protein
VLADVAPREPEPVDPGAELAVVTENAIVIKQEVFFESDKAAIQPRSFRLLATVANLLELHPEITLLRIEGHTDDRGGRGRNLALSQRRAEAVRDHLITVHRIVAVRLMAQGFGPDRPVASNKTTAGRARNRRSEFIIVERKPR